MIYSTQIYYRLHNYFALLHLTRIIHRQCELLPNRHGRVMHAQTRAVRIHNVSLYQWNVILTHVEISDSHTIVLP